MKHNLLVMLANSSQIFGIELINTPDFGELILRFFLNLAVIVVIVRYLYYTTSKQKDYLFSYVMISTIIFLLCFLLNSVKLQIGFALGLFAIFGIIRYRTDSISIKDMTFLFIVIGVSVINALANKKISYAELFFTNLIIIFLVWVMEKLWLVNKEGKKIIEYEKIDLIKPEKESELLADLKERTGLDITRMEIGKIDFLRDSARIRIFFNIKEHGKNFEESSYES
jgi:signal transduction histidine kinase